MRGEANCDVTFEKSTLYVTYTWRHSLKASFLGKSRCSSIELLKAHELKSLGNLLRHISNVKPSIVFWMYPPSCRHA